LNIFNPVLGDLLITGGGLNDPVSVPDPVRNQTRRATVRIAATSLSVPNQIKRAGGNLNICNQLAVNFNGAN